MVYLKALTHDATELLPVFNKTSTKQYKSAIPTADWTDPTFSGANRGNKQRLKSTFYLFLLCCRPINKY